MILQRATKCDYKLSISHVDQCFCHKPFFSKYGTLKTSSTTTKSALLDYNLQRSFSKFLCLGFFSSIWFSTKIHSCDPYEKKKHSFHFSLSSKYEYKNERLSLKKVPLLQTSPSTMAHLCCPALLRQDQWLHDDHTQATSKF